MSGSVKKVPITWAKMPKNGILIITGHRGEGKTALAWWLAETVKKQHRKKKITAVGIPEVAHQHLPKRVNHVPADSALTFLDKTKGHVVIVDEASIIASSRDAMSEQNKAWLKLIRVIRQKDHLLIFISQHNRGLDVQIMMDADYVLMKRPTAMHLRLTKPEFRKEMRMAYELFQDIPEKESKGKVYVVDYQFENHNMLTAKMPKWWTKKVSTMYGDAQVLQV